MANPPLLRKLGRAERALKPHNISHQIDTIRAKVDEIIQALANLNENVTGSPTGTVPAVVFGKWTGSYSTASADGIAVTSLRSDTTLKYPPALGTPTKVMTLSDDATEGALLTADNTFSANSFALKAPNASAALRIGIYGNIALGGGATLNDTVLLKMTKTDYNTAAATPQVFVGTVTNTNVGTGSNILVGMGGVLSATCADAGASTTNVVKANTWSLSGGASGNNNFRGSLIGYEIVSNTLSSQTAGTATPALVVDFRSGTTTITRSALTDRIHFHARSSTTLLVSATLTNHYGLLVDAINAGTNRYGVNIAAITGGTIATGIEIATHSGGTTKRAIRGGNTFECTANDFLASTAGKALMVKDSQANYLRLLPDASAAAPKDMTMTIDADGFASVTRAASATGNVTLKIVDTGTTAPTA